MADTILDNLPNTSNRSNVSTGIHLHKDSTATEGVPLDNPEADCGSCSAPEPIPEWEVAIPDLGLAWDIHVLAIPVSYLIIGCLTCAFNIMLCYQQKKPAHLHIALSAMLVMFCLLRSIALFWDPYNSSSYLPSEAYRMIWALALPLLTSAISLLLLALLDSLKMYLAPPRFQRLSAILLVTGIHIVITLVSEVTLYLAPEAKFVSVVCQVIFSTWGLTLSVGYAVVSYKIKKNALPSSHTSNHSSVSKMVYLIWACAVVGLAVFVTALYQTLGKFGVYSNQAVADHWPWWSLQTALRLEEIALCVLVLSLTVRSQLRDLLQNWTCFCCVKNDRVIIKVEPVPKF